MSAKDAFFKKVQENNEAQQSNEERVRTDVKSFRARVFSLSKDIEQWLHGSGIQVSQSEVLLNDETVSYALGNNADGRYNITQIRLQNGDKNAVLKAEGLYYMGPTGCLSLTITNPYRAPSQTKFTLFMRVANQQEEGWTIVRDGQKSPEGKRLTEDEFFSAIESLA
jgi:hypothetical protein